jgi:hypothetical protein
MPSPDTNRDEGSIEQSLDSLFDPPSAESFKGAEFRTWQDNTGNFAVSARLDTIFPDKVRLLKDNGKFSTVPFRRLSQADQLYVQWVAIQLTQPAGRMVSAPASAE